MRVISAKKDVIGESFNPMNFCPVQFATAAGLWATISKHPWSPIIFKGNYRRKKNFIFSDICALDFDGTILLDEAIKMFEAYHCLIGSTRNHRKDRNDGKGAQDRFRVLIPWTQKITKLEDYEKSMRIAVMHFKGADTSGVDGARQFLPCHDLLHVNKSGLFVQAYKMRQEEVEARQRRQQYYNDKYAHVLPRHVQLFLENGVVFGKSRNEACFVAACYLKKIGVGISEAQARIERAPIPRQDFDSNEIADCVRSAFR